jgi:hypothetical protein
VTARHEEWARGYAKQAGKDFEAFDKLKGLDGVPDCQYLHFLQMACEKLCKAHLCGNGTEPDELQSSHAFIADPLPVVARQQYARLGGREQRDHSRTLRQMRQLAREIELLAPTVTDGGRRPDNCEYPWEDGGRLHVPAEYSFPNLNLLHQPAGRLLLKLIPAAIDELLQP